MLKTPIPLVDLRGKSPIDLLRAYPDKANELVVAARRTFGWWSYAASALGLPLSDKSSHEWLKRTKNPYLYEIETFADILETRGIYSLNLCYEWGCTSGVWRTDETNSLLRLLDWPFPALGKHVVVAWQESAVGDYYNVTWPGMSGIYNAMAPNRFGACINQAPMRKHNLTFAGDWLKNRLIVNRQDAIPPAHLLRQVFEKARSYQEAKDMLSATPLAMPVIYVLSGLELGEGCIIERLEDRAEVIELSAGLQISSANHFNSAFAKEGKGWWPRAIDSDGRYRQSCAISGIELENEHFGWVQPPVINAETRLCLVANASTRRLTVQGFEGTVPVTQVFNLPPVAASSSRGGDTLSQFSYA